jgi:hypothetical protein
MTFFIRFAKGLSLPFALATLVVLQGCGSSSSFPVSTVDSSPNGTGSPGSPGAAGGTDPAPSVQPPSVPSQPVDPGPVATVPMKVAPLWEGPRASAGIAWTHFSSIIVLTEAPDLMKGTADVQSFCPRYYQLNTDEKVNFWVYLISAVTKYESAFNPVSRMRESGLGTDTVTGQHVYSEGLLQLSYQDGRNYSFCNEFDWNKDKLLAPSDPRKTILDPIKNLRCGIRILNKVIGRHNMIAFDSGHYWSTLMPKHAPEHLIQALTRNISICK